MLSRDALVVTQRVMQISGRLIGNGMQRLIRPLPIIPQTALVGLAGRTRITALRQPARTERLEMQTKV